MKKRIKGANGGRFYVKTYGPNYGMNCDYKPVRGGQKWMVYIGNKHVETFRSEADAKRKCNKLNANFDESVKEFSRKQDIVKAERCKANTFSGLSERISFLENALDDLRDNLNELKEHISKLRERYEG